MRLLVTGCGSGGTNLGIELIRSLNHFHLSGSPEDRGFLGNLITSFSKQDHWKNARATKIATENRSIDLEKLIKCFELDPQFRMVFIFRHPVDTCLSKIASPFRGKIKSKKAEWEKNEKKFLTKVNPAEFPCILGQNGDIHKFDRAVIQKDGNVRGAAMAVKFMHSLHEKCKKAYPDRVYELKMEDLIADRQKARKDLMAWLGLEYDNQNPDFWLTTKKPDHLARYDKKLAPNINLYKDLEANWEGMYSTEKEGIEHLTMLLEQEMEYMGYE